jgi:hypothetical protein
VIPFPPSTAVFPSVPFHQWIFHVHISFTYTDPTQILAIGSTINPLVLNVTYAHHTVWCSKCWMTGIADGLSWPLLCSPHFNSSLLHIKPGT